MNNKINIKQLSTGIILFIAFFILYYAAAIILGSEGDTSGHALITIDMINNGDYFRGTFLMYLLAALLSFFSTNYDQVIIAICILLAAATILRFYIAQTSFDRLELYSDKNKNYWLSVLLALSLIFIFAIPVPNYFKHGFMYLGTFTPNVWHNSTTIFLFPFAILLFTESYKQIKDYSYKRNYILIILIFLNIFIKPNFFFVFACVYPLMMLYKYKFSKTFWTSLIPLAFGAVFLFLEYLSLYTSDTTKNISEEEQSSIGFCFMCVYKMCNTYPFLLPTFIFSMSFPLAYTIWNYKELKGNIPFWYTVFFVLGGFLVYFLLVEKGPRFYHGNFFWQVVPCVWLYFYITLLHFVKDVKAKGFILKNKILLSLYSIHVVIGVIYVARIIVKGTYA